MVFVNTLLSRGLATIPSFLRQPPHTWAAHNWARHAVSGGTNPLVSSVLMALYRHFGVQVRGCKHALQRGALGLKLGCERTQLWTCGRPAR